jgi:hypothetical protein
MSDFRLSMQVAPPFILNEGIDRALDFMAGNGLDALHLNSHTYYGSNSNRDIRHWAPDHLPAERLNILTQRAWVMHDPARFRAVGLFHIYPEAGPDGADHFGAILSAARARGMKVHIRYLDGWEPHRRTMPGWSDVCCRTLDGDVLQVPCFAQERVQEWWRLTVEDMADVTTWTGSSTESNGAHPSLTCSFMGSRRTASARRVVHRLRPRESMPPSIASPAHPRYPDRRWTVTRYAAPTTAPLHDSYIFHSSCGHEDR